MKKKLLSLVLAVCLILPVAFMLTGCSKKAYKVAGKTLELSNNVVIEWKADVTDAEKSAFLEEMFGEGKTEEQAVEYFKNQLKEMKMSITFNKDGSVVQKETYKDSDGSEKTEETTYYFSQSKDKKEIKIYNEKDYTAETKNSGYILFKDGHFYLAYSGYDSTETANILVELVKK